MKLPAALLMTTSGAGWPVAAASASSAAATAAGSRTSIASGMTRPPVSALISAAVACSTSSRRAAMATVAPRADRVRLMALPRPVPPPVTKATLPLNVPGGSMGVVSTGRNAPAGLASAGFASAAAPAAAPGASPNSFTYRPFASSALVPFSAAQASYLARPTKSNAPGREPVASPTVACLKSA